jgi:glycogen synthase
VIAYKAGGLMETVIGAHRPNPTGLFFAEQREDSIIAAVDAFERNRLLFTHQACTANAARFSERRFRDGFSTFVEQALADHWTARESSKEPAWSWEALSENGKAARPAPIEAFVVNSGP